MTFTFVGTSTTWRIRMVASSMFFQLICSVRFLIFSFEEKTRTSWGKFHWKTSHVGEVRMLEKFARSSHFFQKLATKIHTAGSLGPSRWSIQFTRKTPRGHPSGTCSGLQLEAPGPETLRPAPKDAKKQFVHFDSLTWKWKMGPWKTAGLYKHTSMLVSQSVCIVHGVE